MAFYIKQNDTSPALQATLKDASGTAISLSGSTVNLHMKSIDGTLKVDAAMTKVDELNGIVKYDWQSGDTDTVGTYYIEMEVTYNDGAVETFPNTGSLVVVVTSELA